MLSSVMFSLQFWLIAFVTILATRAITLVFGTQHRNSKQRQCIRTSKHSAVAQAGSVSLRGDELNRVLHFCDSQTQITLRLTCRAWREMVMQELGNYDPSGSPLWTEANIIAMLAEKPMAELMSAKELFLPASPRFHTGAAGKGFAIFIKHNPRLTALRIPMHGIGDESVQHIAAALSQNATLTEMSLRGCELGNQGAEYLAASLTINRTLTALNLDENGIGAEVHFRPADESAGIGDAGAIALAASLAANPVLTGLSLRSNEIGDVGATALAQACQRLSCGLKRIDLRNNQLSSAGKAEVLQMLDARDSEHYLSMIQL